MLQTGFIWNNIRTTFLNKESTNDYANKHTEGRTPFFFIFKIFLTKTYKFDKFSPALCDGELKYVSYLLFIYVDKNNTLRVHVHGYKSLKRQSIPAIDI